jgi:predicted DNA-binding ribbon-helix-helix protein
MGTAPVTKRSIKIAGHSPSVSLEPAFWDALKEIAAKKVSINDLVANTDKQRQFKNLSSALRLFVLAYDRGCS